ncbi:MAG: hypothetical protein VX668_00810 [Planctomycetota bacterium]|nr:hypothetical protein [Planctomycetota bacterium]
MGSKAFKPNFLSVVVNCVLIAMLLESRDLAFVGTSGKRSLCLAKRSLYRGDMIYGVISGLLRHLALFEWERTTRGN